MEPYQPYSSATNTNEPMSGDGVQHAQACKLDHAWCIAMMNSLLSGALLVPAMQMGANLSAPGVYFGSGNSNGNFTISAAGNIEIGIRASVRYVGAITPSGNVYYAPIGATKVAGKTGCAWGVDFSVNVRRFGIGDATIDDVVFALSMTDVVTGTTGEFDPSLIPDNTEYGPSGRHQAPPSEHSTNWGFQNSETLSFASIADALGDPEFNMNIPNEYDFTLTATDAVSGLLLAATTIRVVVG